jgi:hypothetical protein
MAVGDCQRAFGKAAAADGVVLSSQSFNWLCEQGHFGLLRVAETRPGVDPERGSQAGLGFDLSRYRKLCRKWCEKSDKYRRTKEARGFGANGRQRQRAYYDALRDLATPAMGHPH